MEHCIGDAVFDDDFAGGRLGAVQFVFAHGQTGEVFARDFVAPFAERALGIFHDVALVDEGHAAPPVGDGVFNRHLNQPLAGKCGNGLDAQRRAVEKLRAQLAPQKVGQFGVFRAARRVFDARVNVFGILAEDDDVKVVGAQHWRGHARVMAHRADAGVEVKRLPQGDIERAETAAHRRGQRPLDGDAQLAQRGERAWREGIAALCGSGFTERQIAPDDAAAVAISGMDGGIPDAARRLHDFRADAVAGDAANPGVVRHLPVAVMPADQSAASGESLRGHDDTSG